MLANPVGRKVLAIFLGLVGLIIVGLSFTAKGQFGTTLFWTALIIWGVAVGLRQVDA
jgi:uncharacterized membrane protein YobD (UPF0266 family)